MCFTAPGIQRARTTNGEIGPVADQNYEIKGFLGVNTKVFKVKLIITSHRWFVLSKRMFKHGCILIEKTTRTDFLIGYPCINKQENV